MCMGHNWITYARLSVIDSYHDTTIIVISKLLSIVIVIALLSLSSKTELALNTASYYSQEYYISNQLNGLKFIVVKISMAAKVASSWQSPFCFTYKVQTRHTSITQVYVCNCSGLPYDFYYVLPWQSQLVVVMYMW